MTKLKTKFIVAFTLVFAMLATLVAPSIANFSAYAGVVTDTINLGVFDESTYTFKDATGTVEHTYKTLTFSLACEFVGDEEITLPEVDGYTVKTDLSTLYSKVVDADTAKTAKEFMEEYFSKVIFRNCEEQTISVTLNKGAVQNKVAYFSNNDHFYMYIADTTKNWDVAYNAAKSMTYLGRQGYLATITSVEEDTFIYNAAAYRTPEGSVVEELVKRLPGAQVDESGKITINGKEVKKIKVDGKEFLSGDTKTALKNLPTSIIERVKAYDEKSDLARITGIDDGDESTVLDFGIKMGMNKGTLANLNLGIGTHGRYSEQLMGMYTKSDFRIMGMGSANNTNDMGFPGGGGGRGFGGGRNGLTASKMGMINLNYQGDKLQADGGVRWNHSDGDAFSKTSLENFVSPTGSFSNNLSQNYSRSNSWNVNARLEWKPTEYTNIMFRPQYSYSTNDGLSSGNSGTFNEDPYLYVTDPLAKDDNGNIKFDKYDEFDYMIIGHYSRFEEIKEQALKIGVPEEKILLPYEI